jgi:ABC-type phosphate/phosphonate transport system substrate-binding protein
MLGCVAYGPTVGPIWEGMRQYLNAAGVPFDFIMFTSYDRQLEALVAGSIDIAWNGPLAHTRLKRRTGGKSVSLGMRDCDRNFLSRLIVRKSSGIKTLADLRGKKLAVGAYDSPQANIVPLQAVAAQPDGAALLASIHVVRFDKDLGKHGDTAAGELDVLRALADGEVDAGFVSDVMWAKAVANGDVNGRGKLALVALDAALVPAFDHCQFDAMPTISAAKRDAFQSALFAMSMDKPEEAAVMKLEGIRKTWEQPREEGYASMHAALAAEPADVAFPPPRDTATANRFASLEVRADKGVHATQFQRACV